MKIVGYTESCTVCECCGKTNLKGTFIMLDADTNNEYYFGSTCAVIGGKISQKEISIATNDVKTAKAFAARMIRRHKIPAANQAAAIIGFINHYLQPDKKYTLFNWVNYVN